MIFLLPNSLFFQKFLIIIGIMHACRYPFFGIPSLSIGVFDVSQSIHVFWNFIPIYWCTGQLWGPFLQEWYNSLYEKCMFLMIFNYVPNGVDPCVPWSSTVDRVHWILINQLCLAVWVRCTKWDDSIGSLRYSVHCSSVYQTPVQFFRHECFGDYMYTLVHLLSRYGLLKLHHISLDMKAYFY